MPSALPYRALPGLIPAVCDYPAEADVLSGVTFDNGSQVGTYTCFPPVSGATISGIEDKLIQVLNDLGLFRLVQSSGREELPKTIRHPAAFVYYDGETDTSNGPRPVPDVRFAIVIVAKNLKKEKDAARDAYVLMDTVRGALHGKRLGIQDIHSMKVISRELVHYYNGEIAYEIKVATRHVLPVPQMD